MSHQQLNDHHFHYGYLVRAAAEICRTEPTWCGADQYGPMIELLIRDYAGGRDDAMFPYLRNFDPANGFSWASGKVNFARGNNNESTSEAANAYGAIVLYGLTPAKMTSLNEACTFTRQPPRPIGNIGIILTDTTMLARVKITSPVFTTK